MLGRMRFGTFIPQGWRLDLVGIKPADQWRVMATLAQRADEGPWESLWVYDHFHTVPVATEEATHEAWTLMAAFAAATSRIRLGQMCTCMGYRNPAYLAKVAATIDIISGGRVEMGIGGGWYEQEWRAYGYGFPEIPQRLAKLREGVEIMQPGVDDRHCDARRRALSGGWRDRAAAAAAGGGIPFWIAGGARRSLSRSPRSTRATRTSPARSRSSTTRASILQGHCDALGRDFTDITRSSNFNTIVGATEAEARGSARGRQGAPAAARR